MNAKKLIALAALGGLAYWLWQRQKTSSAQSVVRDAAGNIVRILPDPESTTNPNQYPFAIGPTVDGGFMGPFSGN